MLDQLPKNVDAVCVHTGNILSLNELKKKAGQSPTDELIESLRITLEGWKPDNNDTEETIQIYRRGDDLQKKMDEEDRNGLKISVKIFTSSVEKDALNNAIDNVLSSLKTERLDSVVLAYAPHTSTESPARLDDLKELWNGLEELVDSKKICDIGVSDVDTDLFIALYEWAKVKPSIVQINLASCCVVPPALQTFTKEKDVQLLTHSDPAEILPKTSMSLVFGSSEPAELSWALRFQVHVKCRGVLSSKGYTVCVKRDQHRNP